VRYVTPLSQTRAWKCPTCKRVLPFARDVRWVACGGGRHEDGSFFHKIDDRCYPVGVPGVAREIAAELNAHRATYAANLDGK
jgi:hypothetical protein